MFNVHNHCSKSLKCPSKTDLGLLFDRLSCGSGAAWLCSASLPAASSLCAATAGGCWAYAGGTCV